MGASWGDALFDVTDLVEEPVRASRDVRRTRRIAAGIAVGTHPLAWILPVVKMHPDGDRSAEAGHPPNGPTCGACTHRELLGWPKCTEYHRSLVTSSAATDVRAWWPACTRFTPSAVTDGHDERTDQA